MYKVCENPFTKFDDRDGRFTLSRYSLQHADDVFVAEVAKNPPVAFPAVLRHLLAGMTAGVPMVLKRSILGERSPAESTRVVLFFQ